MGTVTLFRQMNNRHINGRESPAMTMRLLRHRARLINSREQFERIVAQAEHPVEIRRILEPLLRTNLPCCVPQLPPTDGADAEHTTGCPTWKATTTSPPTSPQSEVTR